MTPGKVAHHGDPGITNPDRFFAVVNRMPNAISAALDKDADAILFDQNGLMAGLGLWGATIRTPNPPES